jgi:ribosomal protein L16 Arg81 hydroxylase
MNEICKEWQKWVFECLVEGYEPERLVVIMVEKGFELEQAMQAVQATMTSPFIESGRKYNEKFHKREWLLKTLDWHQRQLPKYTNPKRVPLPPFQDFLRDYYYENRIGIFTGAIDHWKASKWTFDNLVEKVGYDSMVEVQAGREKDESYEQNKAKHKQEIKFGEFIKKVTSPETGNQIYMTAYNHSFFNPNLAGLLDDMGDIGDGFLDMQRENYVGSSFLWIGAKDIVTPLHHDLHNNFFIQIRGKKRWHLVPSMQVPYMYNNTHVFSDMSLMNSDRSQFPNFANASVIEVDVQEGEILFVPIGYWHHVTGLEPSISITMTNFNTHNHFPGYALEYNSRPLETVKANSLTPAEYQKLSELPILKNAKIIDNDKAQLCVIENFLSDYECDELIKLINTELFPSKVSYPDENIGQRTSSTCDLGFLDNQVVRQLEEKIANCLGLSLKFSEIIQGQKYEVGQEFKPHTDFFDPNGEEYRLYASERGNRTWTFMIYLNDTTAGGETDFPQLGKRFAPQKGTAVAWNNLDKEGKPNHNTLHCGMPVIEGEKFIVTKWFCERGQSNMFLS